MSRIRIVTWHDDMAAFWTRGREAWRAVREGWEPPDSSGIESGFVGSGATEAVAIADLLEREEGE